MANGSAQTVFERVAQAQLALVTSRGHMVGAHRGLSVVGRSLGIDPEMYGDGRKDPMPATVFTGADGSQHQVAA